MVWRARKQRLTRVAYINLGTRKRNRIAYFTSQPIAIKWFYLVTESSMYYPVGFVYSPDLTCFWALWERTTQTYKKNWTNAASGLRAPGAACSGISRYNIHNGTRDPDYATCLRWKIDFGGKIPTYAGIWNILHGIFLAREKQEYHIFVFIFTCTYLCLFLYIFPYPFPY